MVEVEDAPWIGHCREEWDEMCRIYDEDEEDYLAEKADRQWKERKENGDGN